jgi:hypothetical protein
MEVPIRKNSMEAIGIAVSGLIEQSNRFKDAVFVPELGLEDVGNLGL